jgi:hypothetical protein
LATIALTPASSIIPTSNNNKYQSNDNDGSIRPVRAISEATPRGFLTEPKLIEVAPTNEVAEYDAIWWAKKTPEECLQLLVDPQSRIGVADVRNWTPLQVHPCCIGTYQA